MNCSLNFVEHQLLLISEAMVMMMMMIMMMTIFSIGVVAHFVIIYFSVMQASVYLLARMVARV